MFTPLTSSIRRSRKLIRRPVTRRESPMLNPTSLTVRSSDCAPLIPGIADNAHKIASVVLRRRIIRPELECEELLLATTKPRQEWFQAGSHRRSVTEARVVNLRVIRQLSPP